MRLTRLFPRIGLSLAGLLLTTANAPGQEVLVDPPALSESLLGREAMTEIEEYTGQMVATFGALDKIVNDPPADVLEASSKFTETCSAVTDALLRARGTARKNVKGKSLPEVYESWFSAQEAAWNYTSERGARAARLVAIFNDSIKTWEKDWIPKLGKKKAAYLEIGRELNEAYHHLENAAAIRSGEGWKAEADAFKTVLRLAENTGRELRNLKSRLIEDVARSAPGSNLFEEWSKLTAALKFPTVKLPKEGIWLLHYGTWEAKLLERMKTAIEVFDKVLLETEPLRKQTLFGGLGKPIAGLHFSRIHPTWQELYDRLLKDYASIQERVAAEEERWKADRERMVELADEVNATKEREIHLKAARADGPSKRREIDVQYGKDQGPDAYQSLFRRMVEDVDLSRGEMEKRATPEFRAEWKKIQASAEASRRAKLDQLEKDLKAVDQELKEFEERSRANAEESRKIEEENARRRKELGLGDKPLAR